MVASKCTSSPAQTSAPAPTEDRFLHCSSKAREIATQAGPNDLICVITHDEDNTCEVNVFPIPEFAAATVVHRDHRNNPIPGASQLSVLDLVFALADEGINSDRHQQVLKWFDWLGENSSLSWVEANSTYGYGTISKNWLGREGSVKMILKFGTTR